MLFLSTRFQSSVSRAAIQVEILALPHQRSVLRRSSKRSKLTVADRVPPTARSNIKVGRLPFLRRCCHQGAGYHNRARNQGASRRSECIYSWLPSCWPVFCARRHL
jgi:hypothetical protein